MVDFLNNVNKLVLSEANLEIIRLISEMEKVKNIIY